MSSLKDRICATARMLGDDELIALANRGLVRRARKDLESASPDIIGDDESGLMLVWDQQTVILAERPAESRCTCPANGMCRHILACLVYVGALTPAGSAPATTASLPCGKEITDLLDEDIERWAGKALLKRSLRELAIGLSVTCQDGAPFIGRIGEWNSECRWMPGGGLAGMLCSCHDHDVCVHRVAVVLAWHVHQGRRTIEREDAVPEASAGAVRSRADVCTEISVLCEHLVQVGFSRLSRTTAERFKTLAMSAHGVDLPRLERSVRSVAEEIDGWLTRQPQASDERLLERLAYSWALAHALMRPTPELVGVHRSQYERVHHLDLIGAGLETWSTPSGYHGLSVYFWDTAAQAWCTWSEARPLTTTGFDPVSRASAPGPWSGASSPRQLSDSTGLLMGAWRNRAMRLSGRSSCRWNAKTATTARHLPEPVTDWKLLGRQLPAMHPVGLSERRANGDVVLIKPTTWHPAVFDSHRQCLVRVLADTAGRPLPIVIPHTPANHALIANMESLTPDADALLLGRLKLTAEGLMIHPISMITATSILSVSLQQGPNKIATSGVGSGDQDDDEPEADHAGDLDAPFSSSIPVLEQSFDACVAVANAGKRAFRQWPLIQSAAHEARAGGLESTSVALDRLAQAHDDTHGATLLLVVWTILCQRQAVHLAASQVA